MRGDIRPAICRIKRMNSASKCLIQHFEALLAIFIADISSESGGNNHNDMFLLLYRINNEEAEKIQAVLSERRETAENET